MGNFNDVVYSFDSCVARRCGALTTRDQMFTSCRKEASNYHKVRPDQVESASMKRLRSNFVG